MWGQLPHVTAVDLSRPALEYGVGLLRDVGADVDVDVRDVPLDGPPQRFRPVGPVDLVIAANVLNELSDPRDLVPRLRCVRGTMDWLGPQGRFLAIEPAMRVEARSLMALRDAVVDNAVVLSPCRGARSCPLLQTRGDWCHQDVAFSERPPQYRALEKAAGLPKDQLAVAHLLLGREGVAPKHGVRVVGGVMVGGDGVERRYACGRDLVTIEGRPRLPVSVAHAERGGLVDDDVVGAGSAPRQAPAARPPQNARGASGPGGRRPRPGPRRR